MNPDPMIEMKLLNVLLLAVESGVGQVETDALRRFFIKSRPTNAEEWTRHFALAKVLGEELELPEIPVEGNGAQQLFIRTALAWMAWANGEPSKAHKFLETTNMAKGGGEIQLMALGFWCRGVGDLLAGDLNEARRYFKRSMDVGSQFGTESSVAIQWAYVGTFFSHRPPTS